MTSLGVLPEPTHYPASLARYGQNSWGGNLWRVVFAPSVKKLVGGKFSDGYIGYRARPAYRHIGSHWILEKWISAYEMTGKSESQYNEVYKDFETGLFPTGPYPTRGVYHYCETLEDGSGFEKIIQLIERGQLNRVQDNARAIQETMEREEKQQAQERFDRSKEMLPAFGVRATSYRGHVKATKTAPMPRSANELRLPVRGPSVMEVHHAV